MHGTEGQVTAMREDSGFYSFTRKQAAELFIAYYMESTEEQRERLVKWWNADNGGDGK